MTYTIISMHNSKPAVATETDLFCSAIIATIGRPSLSHAVESVLQQNLPNRSFEVIVINDSGRPLPKADWQVWKNVRIISTNQRERSVARNTGAAIAKGTYLHFLDDDDWLAPGAYQSFFQLSQTSDANWLYGITQLVDRQHNSLIQLKHNLHGNCFVQAMSGEWIPLQASLIERNTFLRIGGFSPFLTGPEDIDLLRRYLLEEELAETPNLVAYVIMGGIGSTTDYDQHPQASRQAREKLLEGPHIFRRMSVSAVNPFWRGHMLRVYLTSAVWNLGHRRFFGATSRIWSSMVTLLHAGTAVLTKDFWRAVLRPYASLTFEYGIQERRKQR
jgi:Glycosyltransferases involved in cell wall biogenesis